MDIGITIHGTDSNNDTVGTSVTVQIPGEWDTDVPANADLVAFAESVDWSTVLGPDYDAPTIAEINVTSKKNVPLT